MVFRKRQSAGAAADLPTKDIDEEYGEGSDYFDPTSVSGESSDDGTNSALNKEARGAIRDSDMELELMRDIVMRIREDPIYASTIYADCPRLQHKLDERPDLRPVFEDPDLVRINFEQVFREAGGKLPEDEEEEKKKACWRKCLARVVNHPLFKVLRFILLIKKLVGCVTGGGFALVKGCFQRMCCESICEAAGDQAIDGDFDAEGDAEAGVESVNPTNAANRVALNKVADYFEDPEVAEAMNELLENDPEGLEEAIENDPELKALRDSSPLCAELMSDPETMRILVDPDNLRALAECPDLIEADFADPHWEPTDVEQAGSGSDIIQAAGAAKDGVVVADGIAELAELAGDADINDAGLDVGDVDVDAEADADADGEGEEDGEEEEEEGMLEEYEMGEAEGPEAGDRDMANKSGGKGGGKGGNKSNNQQNNGGNRAGGFLAQVGAGITDLVAGEFVGATMGDFIPEGDDDFPMDDVDIDDDALDKAADDADDMADAAEDAAEAAESAALAMENANAIAGATDLILSDDVADNLDQLEDGMDQVEETQENQQDGKDDDKAQIAAAGAGAVACAVAPVGILGGENREADGEEGEEEEEEPKKKGRFGFIGGFASAISTAAKETVAGALLGEDLGELIVEKQEEEAEEEDDEKAGKAEKEHDEPKKKKGLFGRNK